MDSEPEPAAENTICQYELTEKYLSGEITFQQYAELLGDEDPLESEDQELEDNSDDNTERDAGEAAPSSSTQKSGENASPTKRLYRRRNRRNLVLPPAYKGMLGEANLTLARGNAAAAEKMCKEVIRHYPSAPEPFRTLALLHEERGDPDSAFQCHMIAAHLGGSDLNQWLWLADSCRERKLYREAADCYRYAARLSPRDQQLYEQRMECIRLAGDPSQILVLRILQLALRNLVERADVAFDLLQRINKIALEKKDYATSILSSQLVYKHHGARASWEDLHRFAEVLLHREQYADCVSLLCAHCGVTVQLNQQNEQQPQPKVESDSEQNLAADGAVIGDWLCDVTSRDSARVHVPDRVPVDIRCKLLISLIHLQFRKATDELLSELMLCNVSEYGDLYLDVTDALMAQKRHDSARKLLEKVVAVESYNKAGSWLLLAQCLRQLNSTNPAIDAYRRVVQLAPHHTDARLELAELLLDIGRQQEALQALSRDSASGVALDSLLLLRKCEILIGATDGSAAGDGTTDDNERDCCDELIETVETLLTQHCPVVRSREDAESMLILPKSREHHVAEQKRSDVTPANFENTGVLFVDRPVDVHRHWNLLLTVLAELESRGEYQRCFQLLLRARGSREFTSVANYHFRMDAMLSIASLKTGDVELSFPVLRRLLLSSKIRNNPAIWNILNLAICYSMNIRHARFLMRLTHRMPEVQSLCLLNGHNCFMSGTYKYALVEYLAGHKLAPEDPLAPLLVAITMVQQVCQKVKTDKASLVAQATAFLRVYARLRGVDCQEVNYNTARAFHQMGLLSEAVHYYQRALECRPTQPSEQQTTTTTSSDEKVLPSTDLCGEAGYNLSLIYRSSGNHQLAAYYVRRYCCI